MERSADVLPSPLTALRDAEAELDEVTQRCKSRWNRDERGFGWEVAVCGSMGSCADTTKKLLIVTGFRVGDRSRGRYATPADSPRHDGTPYRGLRVRRWGLGFAHR